MIFTTNMLKEKYRGYANILDKIKRDTQKGILFRLTKGLYEDNKNANPIFLAAPILSPSYISFDTALSFYGLIPERVVAITSASFQQRKNKTFTNFYGRFEFTDIPEDAFPCGITIIEDGEYGARIATKEKAICDSLCKWRIVKSVKGLKQLLFEDKRIDEDEFSTCDFKEMLSYAKRYKKTNLNILIELIKKEYDHE